MAAARLPQPIWPPRFRIDPVVFVLSEAVLVLVIESTRSHDGMVMSDATRMLHRVSHALSTIFRTLSQSQIRNQPALRPARNGTIDRLVDRARAPSCPTEHEHEKQPEQHVALKPSVDCVYFRRVNTSGLVIVFVPRWRYRKCDSRSYSSQ